MHLDFIVEGIVEELDEFEKWWSTRVAMLKCTDKKGKEFDKPIQIGLRPRRAYTLIFPKEILGAVMNTLNPEDCSIAMVDGKGTKRFGVMFRMLRKLLRLKKLPEKNPADGILPLRPFNNTRVLGLGIREDTHIVTEEDGSKHEGL